MPHTGIVKPDLRRTRMCVTWEPMRRRMGGLVFDINDFDETIRGPFEWDLKRLATSLVLAGREKRRQSARNVKRPYIA